MKIDFYNWLSLMETDPYRTLSIAADGLQVLLCLLAVWLLIRQGRRRARRRRAAQGAVAGTSEVFLSEIWRQALRQQTEQVFDKLQQTLQAERETFSRLFELSEAGTAADRSPEAVDGDSPAAFRLGEADGGDASVPSGTRYQEVIQMAASGLDARRISRRLEIPQCETELVLKMQRLAAEADQGGAVQGPASYGG